MEKAKDKELYKLARLIADQKYKKSSAYKSGFIIKTYKLFYKDIHGDDEPFINDNKPKKLKQWLKEDWTDIDPNEGYPVYRPTKRINKSTPLLPEEIQKENLQEQIKLKQKIKGKSNLPPFKKKN